MGDPEVNITLGAHSDQSESRRFICATVTAPTHPDPAPENSRLHVHDFSPIQIS